MKAYIKKPRGDRGSLTVEACLVLPIFLCFFFFLLFLVQGICIQVTLDHAVGETAREIAATAYPFAIINEMEEESWEETGQAPALQDAAAYLQDTLQQSPLGEHLTELLTTSPTGGPVERYWDAKARFKRAVAWAVLEKHLDKPYLDRAKLILGQVELPQSGVEFEYRKRGLPDSPKGLSHKQNYGQDDVVIQVEYHYQIPLPFFHDHEITSRHFAVERAWLQGSYGIVSTGRDESIFKDDLQDVVVYVTRTGKKYHREDCRYLRKSKKPLYLKEAQKSYQPCKVCHPPQ